MTAPAPSLAASRRRTAVLTVIIAVATVVLLWLMQGMETVCQAIYPAPASCAADARRVPGLVSGAATIALAGATFVTNAVAASPRARTVAQVLLGGLVVVAILGLGWTLGASGFVLGW
ncbi:hypothetical protein [Georgenia subflava]|uniref:Uncharacterized protein n=1 Tax=Georgenia subflava TaxID=1622177 RepID=A0A6N7EM53_9MICO|nr:hypothetical protein [Georgenia subflava]MPV38208.1 hypothetical protein [Georgenia subflava]